MVRRRIINPQAGTPLSAWTSSSSNPRPRPGASTSTWAPATACCPATATCAICRRRTARSGPTRTSGSSTSCSPTGRSGSPRSPGRSRTPSHLYLATDPDREGEAISWHLLAALKDRDAIDGVDVKRVVFHEITRRAVTEAMRHPRDLRYRPDRRLSGAPRARLPGRLHAVAGALAQAPGLALGRARAVGGAAPDLRARGRDRGVPSAGILEHPGRVHHAAGGGVPGAPEPARRQEAGKVRSRRRGRRQARDRGDRGARVPGRERREEAGPAPPGAAVRHRHLAAGGVAQARLRRRSDHAHRPAPVRGRESERRDGRPDHLHAHRQRPALGRGARGLPAPDRAGLRRALPAGQAARLSHQDQERPGGARGDPADRSRAHAPGGRAACSRTTSAGSTS